ncbi:MAG: hypothetical protein AB7V16_08665 [Vulcanibacillus sp.]
MKQGRTPTRRQKIVIKKAGLDHNCWLITKNLLNELHLVHRNDTCKKTILKKGENYEVIC